MTSTDTAVCRHLDAVNPDIVPSSRGCLECLQAGSPWVHLRLCLSCGHVGCCDSSPNKHASRHAHSSGHPLIRSFEPGEDWWWCYVDEVMFEVEDDPFAGLHH
ncbi:MAG TPA: UBP-type zinc finger domain-containing protein [Candidatus Dormibacteraeota bacterium]|jgi:hypothetical protein|nr:UBP-type zinc finger domain-containing protein [Candidatus Dormibacteraeota bacterium]